MILTPLGHTEFLLDITGSHGKNVRILVDSWLSGYAVGDLMQRRCDIQIDPEKIKTVDIIYLSHSHTDHFDPYTLVEIYKHASPILIIPMTLQYLVPLLQEFIQDVRIEILFPETAFVYEGVSITGYMFPESEVSNEGDVMTLAIENDHELLFAEIDTVPEEDDLETQKELFQIFTKKEYTTACYIASRNELAGELKALDFSEDRRKSFRSEYIAGRKEEMYFSYQKFGYEDFSDFPNIFTIPNIVRGFIGQGITYPKHLSKELSEFQIFPLSEIASMESDLASECGYVFPQKALLPGRQYRIENGTIEAGRKEYPIGEFISNESAGINSHQKRMYASGPLFPRTIRDLSQAKTQILEALNQRFLPYWSANPIANLRDSLIKNDGLYRIRLRITGEESILFMYSLGELGFIEVSEAGTVSKVDEEYWMDDVLDFLDGKQELYSNFWHTLDAKKVYRLWICLGANFMNHDLVLKKYRLHFERAIRGETSTSWMLSIKLD